jgi:hypothetical protein
MGTDVARTGTHLDLASWIVVFVTLVLFGTAVFVKGLGHDLLLEAGVFLVSVKLILMAHKSGVSTAHVSERLDELQTMVRRIDAGLAVRTDDGPATPDARPQAVNETEGLPAGNDVRR